MQTAAGRMWAMNREWSNRRECSEWRCCATLTGDVRRVVPDLSEAEMHSWLVLHACPYLQRLTLTIHTITVEDPKRLSQANTFPLVFRLRSLCLAFHNDPEVSVGPLFGFCTMLDGLPHLSSLRCPDLPNIEVEALLAIASHSTLDVDSGGADVVNGDWFRYCIYFPISVEEDEASLTPNGLAYRRIKV